MSSISRRDRPHIYSIPTALSFVDSLVAGLNERFGDNPAIWPSISILVPNRRAVRALSEAFLRARRGKAALLPHIRPIGDVSLDDLAFEDAALGGGIDIDIPPAIPELDRLMLLARLIRQYMRSTGQAPSLQPAEAVKLARHLARLLDQIQTERLNFDKLTDIAPAQFAQHWQRSLEFLSILTDHWPKILGERGQLDPSARRNKVLETLNAAWTADPPRGPIIAAGSTGTIPAVADLLGTISRLPQGALVLPGLDTGTGEDYWRAIEESHPQYGMKRLLKSIDAHPWEVESWSRAAPDSARARRIGLVRAAMAPAPLTADWRLQLPESPKLEGLSLIEADNPREEASAIAFALREALEQDGKTAALVTPDTGLARRVAGELMRWGVKVDNSAGQPLRISVVGRFLRLVAEAVHSGLEPVRLLALLKHPFSIIGDDKNIYRRRVRQLEERVLRGVRPAASANGLRHAAHSLGERELVNFVDALADLAAPFEAALKQPQISLDKLIGAHLDLAETLAGGRDILWSGDDGSQAADFVTRLKDAAPFAEPLAGEHYPALFSSLIEPEVVRSVVGRHPRLAIWGAIEARMQQADRLILAGLNEAGWPAEIKPDPWMSEPMRQDFGLPAAARRIGLSAHDFVQALGAPDVILSRSLKAGGAPTVPSRWLRRLEALAPLDRAQRYIDWARAIDRPRAVTPIAPPAPRPPLEARPTRLSVTQIETWMRDPYALYARHILGLKALDPLDADPGASEKGVLIHAALELFLNRYGDAWPEDPLHELLKIGEEIFAPLIDRPAVWGFWWPRFKQSARWFVAAQEARRASHLVAGVEIRGEWPVPGTKRPFTLTGTADRIDRLADGGYEIIDYKTGAVPSAKRLKAGYAPQLPLEAILAEEGAFSGLPAGPVARLSYWKVKGGDPAGEITEVKDVETRIEEARRGLVKLIDHYAKETTPYLPSPRPAFAGYGDYDHLARLAEWRGGGEAED